MFHDTLQVRETLILGHFVPKTLFRIPVISIRNLLILHFQIICKVPVINENARIFYYDLNYENRLN